MSDKHASKLRRRENREERAREKAARSGDTAEKNEQRAKAAEPQGAEDAAERTGPGNDAGGS